MNVTLNEETAEKLEAFAQILEKKPTSIINEALDSYFKQAEKMILEKSMSEKDPDTDIGFDEFWDGVEL